MNLTTTYCLESLGGDLSADNVEINGDIEGCGVTAYIGSLGVFRLSDNADITDTLDAADTERCKEALREHYQALGEQVEAHKEERGEWLRQIARDEQQRALAETDSRFGAGK